MIWLITFVIFLGSVVVVMLVFWFLFRRKTEQQRMELRIATRVGLELSGPDEPLNYEITFTENVSRHGARVITKRHWSPNDGVLVRLPQEGHLSRARITYCQPLKGDAFAIGLQFSSFDWIGSP
jgi:PilZ domain-containing protein